MADIHAVAEAIKQALPLFTRPDDVVEIRFLEVDGVREKKNAAWIVAGNVDKFARQIASTGMVSSTYFTPQVLKPELLGRRKEGFFAEVRKVKGVTTPLLTHDEDCTGVRFLLVDVDPVRPEERRSWSSTSSEKNEAFRLLAKVRETLTGKLSNPLIVDSGNGYHAYYPLPFLLPNESKNSTGPLSSVLKALARLLDNEAAKIDTTVYNASRIMKLPGTMSKKGRNTPERPHRQSKILEVPEGWISGGPTQERDIASWLLDLAESISPAPKNPLPPQTDYKRLIERMKGEETRPREMSVEDRARAYIAKMEPAISGQFGHKATYNVACRLVNDFALPADVALSILGTDYNARCVQEWSEGELRHKVESASNAQHDRPRGCLANPTYRPHEGDADFDILKLLGFKPKGEPVEQPTPTQTPNQNPNPPKEPEPVTLKSEPTNIVAEDTDSFKLAKIVLGTYQHKGICKVRRWAGRWYVWANGAWTVKDKEEFEADVRTRLEKWFCLLQEDKQGQYHRQELDQFPKKIDATPYIVNNVTSAIQALCILDGKLQPPCWIGKDDCPFDVPNSVATTTQIIDLPKFLKGDPEAIIPATPDFFNLNALSFSVNLTEEKQPTQWFKFLSSIWGDDAESKELLREWLGYVLTQDTSLQKMFLLIGEKRGGKGTIADIMRELVGDDNAASLSSEGMTASHFSLDQLTGKSIAVFDEFNLPKDPAKAGAMVDTLLAISGNGKMMIDRKYLDIVSRRISARIVACTNNVPNFREESGAIVSRWSVLKFPVSFLGREDTDLLSKLKAELPLIFHWAVKGWERLKANRKFTKPKLSENTISLMEGAGAPVKTFIQSRCEVGAGKAIIIKDLYKAWKDFCDEIGEKNYGASHHLTRKLADCGVNATSDRKRYAGNRYDFLTGITLQDECHENSNDPFYSYIEKILTDQAGRLTVCFPNCTSDEETVLDDDNKNNEPKPKGEENKEISRSAGRAELDLGGLEI